jgi:hypoxanthine phosphoribosyltransferase
MSRQLFRLTWNDFDQAVRWIADEFAGSVQAIYGEPRGGLPLAVALSHRLAVPLVTDLAIPGVLWIDDIADTGKTLNIVRSAFPHIQCAVWVKHNEHAIFAPITLYTDQWVLFPWEQETAAQQDSKNYELSRQ